MASSAHPCDACGIAPGSVGFSDTTVDPPRYLRLCQQCVTAEKGALFHRAILETGEALPPELEHPDADTLVELGNVWETALLDAMDAAALAEREAVNDPEALRSLARVLEHDAAWLGRELSPAQKAFVRRHPDQDS